MSLGAVIDTIGTFLQNTATPRPVLSGGVAPTAGDELPAVTLTLSDATRVLTGVGRIPRPPRTGALRVATAVDLADPVIRFPGEPPVSLLSGGRTVLQLPHAPLVTADGSPIAALGPADLQASVGATTFTVVTAPPAATDVRPDGQTGILTFGAALPPTGTLSLAYFIGQWDVRSARYQGVLGVEVYADSSAAVSDLSQSVDQALLAEPLGSAAGLRQIAPRSWGSVVAASGPTPGTRTRSMRYQIDIEIEEPIVPTGGGLIARVRVMGDVDGQSEVFDVTS
jgi:hypothetical protein